MSGLALTVVADVKDCDLGEEEAEGVPASTKSMSSSRFALGDAGAELEATVRSSSLENVNEVRGEES